METGRDRAMNCPFFFVRGCRWYGLVTELADHVVNTHNAAHASNPIIVELDNHTIHQFIVTLHSKVFFVQLGSTPSLYKVNCLVKCLSTFNTAESHTYEYFIELEQQNLRSSFLGKIQDIGELHQMQSFDFRDKFYRNTKKCKVTISRKSGVTAEQGEAAANRETRIKLCEPTYLNEIRCPVCINNPNSSIFICDDGHRICYNCINNIHDCLSCLSKANMAEDNTLKNLMEIMLHPCKYFKYGCQEILSLNIFEEHVIECSYKAIKCPDEACGAEIKILDLHDHFEEEHPVSKFDENTEFVKDLSDPTVTYHWSVVETDLFVLGIQYQPATEIVKFDCIHLPRNGTGSNNYAFKLKFPSKTDANLKFSVGNICKTYIRDFGENPVVVPLQMFEPCIVNEPGPTMYFKCLIKKM